MKVAIATIGRFHVLDLARELSALGHEVLFYSCVPKRRALRFGLPAQCHRGLLFWLAPFILAQRYGGRRVKQLVNPWLLRFADWLIAQNLEPCDVFIGMSGLCIRSSSVARERYGAKVFIERGSRHILSQKEILDSIKSKASNIDCVPNYAVARHLESTRTADVVVIPSRHVAESFMEHGFELKRLFVNPYGVDLGQFAPTPNPCQAIPRVIYVGSWSYRKGCDLLSEAVRRFNGRVQLVHVGSLADAPVPAEPWFQHQDPVPQWQLIDWYSQAHVFAMASREEGLALVQAQALACGLPVVCTDRTGGADLAELTDLHKAIFVVPHDDIEALVISIERALEWNKNNLKPGRARDILGDSGDILSWRSYGKRYGNFLIQCKDQK
jgi:starch synthase